ncbi:protein required for normal CLN1 and CLN2 G1 cyclin expression, partial [Cryomyces antarcticus]
MAPLLNGHTNGLNGHTSSLEPAQRFADIPSAIDIPVSGGEVGEEVEVNLEELLDDPTELCTLLENENVAKSYWMIIALAYAKQRKIDHAIEMLTKGLGALSRGRPDEKLSLLACLCWLYLWKCREAPRVKP